MKTLFVILSIFFLSVSLFAEDSCFVNTTLTGIATGSGVNGPVTATLSGNVTNKSGNTISANVTGQVSGSIVGSISGTITATITNSTNGSISGNFVGIATGIASSGGEEKDPSLSVTCNTNGNVNGNIICIPVIESESNCGSSIVCPGSYRYSYTFCTPDGGMETICTNDPHEYIEQHPGYSVRTANLPLRLNTNTLKLGTAYQRFNNTYSYTDATGVKHQLEDVQLFISNDSEENKQEVIDAINGAANRWNCVCMDTTSSETSGTTFDVVFSTDPEDFGPVGGPDAAAGCTFDGRSYPCGVSYATIYFNNTPQFLYGTEEFPEKNAPYSPPKRAWVLPGYRDNATPLVEPYSKYEVRVIDFTRVALHEIGHIFGFRHYDSFCKDEEGKVDNGGGEGVMHYTTRDIKSELIFKKDPYEGLTQYDKCMFAKLYCPGIVGIKEELPVMPNISVSPNPATGELNISFEVLDGVKPVTIRLCNEQGQILYTFMSEVMYSAGTHTYNAKLDLPTGIYFILTTINKTMYSEKFIAK